MLNTNLRFRFCRIINVSLSTLNCWFLVFILLLLCFMYKTSRLHMLYAGPKIVCFLTQSVQFTLSSVQLTLLECVMWSSKIEWRFLTEMISYLHNYPWKTTDGRPIALSLNHGKNEQICTVKFQNFLGQCPRPPYLAGATAPLPRPPFGTPALRASVPRSGPSALGSSIIPLCVVDILCSQTALDLL